MEELEFKTLEELLQYIANVGQEELTKIEDKAPNYSESDGSDYGWGAKAPGPIIIGGSLPYSLEERSNESGASSLVVTNKVNVALNDFEDLVAPQRTSLEEVTEAEYSDWNEYLKKYRKPDESNITIDEASNNTFSNSMGTTSTTYNSGTPFTPYMSGGCNLTYVPSYKTPMLREVTITLKRDNIYSNREYLKKVAKLLELLDGTNWEVVDYFIDGNTNRD